MENKLAHLVVEGNTYDIQDEELTNKFDGMTIELSLSNDYVITATLKDGNNTILNTSTIDLPIENSIVSLGYDTTTNEIIGIYRDDTVAVPHRIRVALSNLQEKLTAGQNISITNNTVSLLGLGEASTETVTGIATLDNSGKVPSSQLPSYVDDVLEYSTLQDFPVTGETGKIYVTLDTNLTYRWSGSVYVEISQSLALGETSSTAYRGDRGKTAYDHAAAKGSAYQSGLYKITTNSEGHVTNATVVQKSDITELGIPAQDTQPNNGKLTLLVNNDQSTKVEFTANDSTDKTFNVTQPIYDKAIEIVNNQVSVKYADKQWDISRDYNNKLFINGKFVKQVEDLDAYTDAPDGEIVEYIGETNSNYTNGYFYKRIAGGSTAEYETITIPPNKTYITYHFPDNTEETGYEVSEELSVEQAQWYWSYISSVTSSDGGTYTSTDYEKWRIFIPIAKVGDEITYNGQHKGVIESLYIEISFPNTGTYNLNFFDEIINDYGYFSSPSLEDAIESYKNLCDQNNLQYGQYSNTYLTVKGVNAVIENKHYKIFASGSSGGYGSNAAIQLISVNGNRLFLESCSYIQDLTHLVSNEIRQNVSITLKQDGTTTEYVDNNLYFYNNPKYNSPTTATLGTTTEPITLTVPILYNEDGTLKDIETTPAYWQRIDVQPTPNDVVMCKMSDGIVYDSYITYTKIKQYLPDYPYYSDNLNWEIGGNPPMRASITEGDYYLDVDTNHIFVADENIELVDVTSSVVIQGDTNKLYCDTNTNQLYRYDGSNFVALTSEGKTYTLSSNDENIRLTDSDGQIQDLSLNTLINGLDVGNSDPQDDDYIVAQYAGGGTTTTSYHRRPLSKFWNWIKSKLGIGTNDGTFLRKDGTWATPTATIYLGIATGNSLIAFIKTKISNGYKVGFLTAKGSSVNGCPDSTNTWIIQYQCDTSIGNAIQLMAWCYGSAWAIRKGYAWNNTNNEPSWKTVAYAEDYVAKAGDTMSGNLTTPALKISGGRTQGSGDDEGLVIAPCSNNSYAALTLAVGGDPQTASGKYHSTFYLQGTGSYNMFWRASVNGTIYDIQHPKKSGTIALTSDIQENTWRPLGTGATDACAGNDSRIPTTSTTSGSTSGGSYQCAKYGRVATVLYSGAITQGISLPAAYKPLITVYAAGATANMSGTISTSGSLATSGASGTITFTYITAS